MHPNACNARGLKLTNYPKLHCTKLFIIYVPFVKVHQYQFLALFIFHQLIVPKR